MKKNAYWGQNKLVFKARFRPSVVPWYLVSKGSLFQMVYTGALTTGLGFDSGDAKDAGVRWRPWAYLKVID